MRTLAGKLTLAFLLVGLIGALLVALLASLQTRTEFDRFREERDAASLVLTLANYYQVNQSWSNVDTVIQNSQNADFYGRLAVVTDASGLVVRGNRDIKAGTQLPQWILEDSKPITLDGTTIGYLQIGFPDNHTNGPEPPPVDVAFLQRVVWAISISAVVATLIALLLGFLLARGLTRPIRELTAATKAMASGKLDQQVNVHSNDEIGELARSFNQMSSDLAHSDQLRKQMTADLAHDLRTPLSILRGYAEGLKDQRINGTPALYNLMFEEVEHLQRLVEDLRVLSLADAGELSLNRRVVDPRALLERTGLAYFVQAEEHGVELKVNASDSLPSISVDTDRMTQVLNNLVSNALRYTNQGEIVISATSAGGDVQLMVSDTGTGIEAEDLPFIFDRFYRADKARHRATNTNQSGLGLAIVKAIVEAHGGTISVASTAGYGTTFTIRLPAVESMPARQPSERVPVPAHRGRS